jgi:hypothetical protein
MRPLALTLLAAGLLAAGLPARDGPDDRRPTRRASDPERRGRLQQSLAAFHRLSPETQAKVRQLDKALHEDEDVATRVRLFGVMERYAGWLARLPEADRRRINSAPAGPDRLRVVRDTLDQQWLDGLPPAYHERLAKAAPADRTRLLEKWRKDEHDRQQERILAMRKVEEEAFPLMAVRQRQFRDAVQKYVKDTLEKQLSPKEKQRLAGVEARGPGYAYFHQVLMLSDAHRLKPPGPAEAWERFRDPRPRWAKPPE